MASKNHGSPPDPSYTTLDNISFYDAKRHLREMGKEEIEAFLSHLASREKVSASTQRQALNAIIFLYRYVLLKPVEGEIAPVRAKRHPMVPGMRK